MSSADKHLSRISRFAHFKKAFIVCRSNTHPGQRNQNMNPQHGRRMGDTQHRLSSSGPPSGQSRTGHSSEMVEHNDGDRNAQETLSRHLRGNIATRNPHAETNDHRVDRLPPEAISYQQANHDLEQGPPETALPESRAEEPLNGRTAWLHAITGFFVVANCWGLGNCWGLFQAYYEISYLNGTPPSSIAWIGSTQLALVFGFGFPVGKLIDMGYFHTVFHTGSCLMVLGIFCTAWCTSLSTLWLTQGLLTGSGMGLLFCSGSTCSQGPGTWTSFAQCSDTLLTLIFSNGDDDMVRREED